MRESFGTRLRHRREQRHLSLTAIAEQTKIKQSHLEALERDDVSHWPSGIFRRSFIRAYAQAIGLEPDALVHEFLAIYPDPVDEAPAVSAPMSRMASLMHSAVGALSWTRNENLRERPTPAVSLPNGPFEPNLLRTAQLCTDLGRASSSEELQSLLEEAVRLLDAVGLVIWAWNPQSSELRAALACGYSEQVCAQWPAVPPDAHNATAEAFRSAELCTVAGSHQTNSALVAPLMTPFGCQGVLAVELHDGRERLDAVRAVAAIIAAQVARWSEGNQPALVSDRRLAS